MEPSPPTDLETVVLPSLGTDRYELLEMSGDGAIAEVYKAVDRETNALVAIKVMQHSAVQLEAVQRLAQEVAILAELDHPGIVRVYDTGVADDESPYVVMEWVEGQTLRHRLLQERCPPKSESINILSQIGAALQAAHDHAVVHRDLKPENVILRPDGVVKVVDFGMAKVLRKDAPILTTGLKIFGTPQYMAPERARGKAVSAAADVYALGIIAYEMLTGRRPFDGKQAMDVLLAQVNDDPPPPKELSDKLQLFVLAALAKDPQRRPSAQECVAALERATPKAG